MQSIVSGFFARFTKSPVTKERNRAHHAGFVRAADPMQAKVIKLKAELDAIRTQHPRFEIRDNSNTPIVACDTSIYGPERMPVMPDMVAKMRAEVALAVVRNGVQPPTNDQWKMIVADHPASCVVAGAGSGKSTTLVLRVAFMVCHLGIRPADMTVFSFTTESCKELRKKLVEVMEIDFWKARMHPQDAAELEDVCTEMVKTFHSGLARQFTSGVRWFDVLKDESESEKGGKGDKAKQVEDFDNPITTGSKLSEPQMDLLLAAYRNLFAQDAEFRGHVMKMLKMDCDSDLYEDTAQSEYRLQVLKTASARDLEVVKRINAQWAHTGWALPGIDPTPCEVFRAEGEPFYANGRIVETGMPVFLSLNGFLDGNALFAQDETIGEGKQAFPLHKAMVVRRKVVAKYLGKPSLHLTNKRGIDRLRLRVKFGTPSDFATMEAPRFDVLLKGEIKKSDVVAAFYAQASFIENLGMEVPATLARLGPFKQHAIEYHFSAALARFWPAFEASLQLHPGRFMTFNRAFLQLGEAHLDRPVHNPAQPLRPFTHLLVDEFQDISPQIVSWLRANQRRLLELGKAPTLMAIGDDWQSIYGWRGSAPEYFIDFGKHFPASAALNGHGECRMMENYRSVAPIIADAEKLLQSVRIKIDKQAKAMRPLETSDHGVTVVQGVSASKNAQRVVDEIHKQLAFVNTLPKADAKKVVVLSRTQKSLQLIEKLLGPVPGVKFYTFHGAKGLQGEVAILCDDCAYDQQHALRNAVYAISPIFKQSYDDASKDEALRLAYVAVTRGIRRVVWFLDEPKGAATLLTSAQAVTAKMCESVL